MHLCMVKHLKKKIESYAYVLDYADRFLKKKDAGKYSSLAAKLRNGNITLREILNDDATARDVFRYVSVRGVSLDDTVIDILKNEGMSLSERGNISDAIEFCTRKEYPLGAGHSAKYWRNNDKAGAQEFFAETLDGKVANPKALAQMRRVFPNAVNVVEEIVAKEVGK